MGMAEQKVCTGHLMIRYRKPWPDDQEWGSERLKLAKGELGPLRHHPQAWDRDLELPR